MCLLYEGYRMRIESNQPAFGAKVDEKFVNAMRGYINHGENRLKNNYKLNQKIETYDSFGHDDYTVQLHQKYTAMGTEYALKAVKDGENPDNAIVLAKRNSFRAIVNKFLHINRSEFNGRLKQG